VSDGVGVGVGDAAGMFTPSKPPTQAVLSSIRRAPQQLLVGHTPNVNDSRRVAPGE
jgi:hypothetical protein